MSLFLTNNELVWRPGPGARPAPEQKGVLCQPRFGAPAGLRKLEGSITNSLLIFL